MLLLSRQPTVSLCLVAVLAGLFLMNGPSAIAAQKRNKIKRPAPAQKAVTKPVKTQNRTEPELKLERLPPDPSVENADIAITAHVRARSLTFETVPNVTVEFPGHPARDTVWEAERENLPTPVQPGVTYRNIGIRLKITSVFRDIDRIVAEALGEVPVTDDQTTDTQAVGTTSSKPKAAAINPKATSRTPPVRQRR